VQEKLASTLGRGRKKAGVGVYPLEKITWPINYEGRDPAKISFTPLGATKAMTALQILETHETGKKYAH
jgi:phenylalanyl-tRNA synthetase beta chain